MITVALLRYVFEKSANVNIQTSLISLIEDRFNLHLNTRVRNLLGGKEYDANNGSVTIRVSLCVIYPQTWAQLIF